MSSQNQFITNSLRQGLNSSLRDHNSSKSVSNQTQQHKSGKSRHFGVLQQLKKREEDWNDRFYVQQIPIFKQQSAKSNLRVQSTKVSVKNSNNASKLQESNFESIRIRRITQDSVVSIQRPSTSQFQYQVKQTENNNGVVNKYIKELQNQGVRPPSVNYSTTHPHTQSKQASFHENASSLQQSQTISEETIKNLKIQINKLWEENNIPDFHRVLYVECTKQFKKKQFATIIQQEIQSLKERKSFIQICLRALRARQQCIKTIREYILQEQENQQNLSESSQHKFGELIVHLRILTLNIVESILRWRDYLSQLLSVSSKQKMQNIKFLFQGENYLLTLQNDYSFICDSYLQNYFSFWSSTSDPFFLASQSSNNSFICNNPIKGDVLQRIRASELILLEEKIFAKLEIKQKELLISPLGLFEDEAEDFLSNYLKEIPAQIQIKMKIKVKINFLLEQLKIALLVMQNRFLRALSMNKNQIGQKYQLILGSQCKVCVYSTQIKIVLLKGEQLYLISQAQIRKIFRVFSRNLQNISGVTTTLMKQEQHYITNMMKIKNIKQTLKFKIVSRVLVLSGSKCRVKKTQDQKAQYLDQIDLNLFKKVQQNFKIKSRLAISNSLYFKKREKKSFQVQNFNLMINHSLSLDYCKSLSVHQKFLKQSYKALLKRNNNNLCLLELRKKKLNQMKKQDKFMIKFLTRTNRAKHQINYNKILQMIFVLVSYAIGGQIFILFNLKTTIIHTLESKLMSRINNITLWQLHPQYHHLFTQFQLMINLQLPSLLIQKNKMLSKQNKVSSVNL
ncbi:hypothetical protein ABPG74_015758 [Tetrahymena malaccensis]